MSRGVRRLAALLLGAASSLAVRASAQPMESLDKPEEQEAAPHRAPVGNLSLPYPVGAKGSVFYTSLEISM